VAKRKERQRLEDLHVKNRSDWRRWLSRNSEKVTGVWVVLYKKETGQRSVSYDDLVEEALCFGWIDSIVRTIDTARYAQRFTPRKPDGTWSAGNIARVKRLEAAGLMTPAGRAAFATHADRLAVPHPTTLPPELEREFKRNDRAWRQFTNFPPGYQRTTIGWVASAKRAETRRKRLAELIAASARAERIEFT